MAARPEEVYHVKGELDNPFTALNKEAKKKKQEEEQKLKEADRRAKEERERAEKEARKEEARRIKEQELANKIRQRTEETENKIQEETRRKAEAKAAEEERRLAEEERKKQEKEAAQQRKQAEEEEKRRKKEEEIAEKKRVIEAAKAAAKERREQQLREEEALAAKRAQEIAEARELQKKVEEAKKVGKIPENFIPVLWGLSDAERREISEILERPYWEPQQGSKPSVQPKPIPSAPKDFIPSDVIKSTSRTADPWLEGKRSQMNNLNVPWSGTLMQTVSDLTIQMPVSPPTQSEVRHRTLYCSCMYNIIHSASLCSLEQW